MRNDQQNRRDQKYMDVAREGDSTGYSHRPNEGEDRAEREQHEYSMMTPDPELVLRLSDPALLFAQ